MSKLNVDIISLEKSYNSKNPLVKYYFHIILKNAVKMAKLKNNEKILDYGCGYKVLKEKLPNNVYYLGYDIHLQFNEVENIDGIETDVIFALNVLEHFNLQELDDFIKFVKSKNPRFLVTALPTQNILSRVGGRINKTETFHFSHITDYKTIKNILAKNFNLIKTKNIFTMNIIDIWKIKDE